ncbi:MAG: nitric-oxide reductase large subunit, partial [Thermodesulfobacteriota bacterium]
MEKPEQKDLKLAPAWRYAALFVFLIGMAILGFLSADAYRKAPPIPERVVGPDGETVFTGDDIRTGQQVFLRYGLMENGSIWGHGAYLGPDFSAAYLHELAIDANENLAREMYGKPPGELTAAEQGAVEAETREILKKNRYDPESGTLGFTAAEVESFRDQMKRWRD